MTDTVSGSIVSHYRILSRLGEGGMGVVFLAEDITLSRRAALKFLPEKTQTDPVMLERFLREARAASALNHPGICTIYEFGEHQGRSFLAMEYIEGDSLDKRLTTHPMSLERLLDLGIQAADALDAAHSKGIVHRDIKPANIVTAPSGQVKILDFGLAKLTEVSNDDGVDKTAAGPFGALTSAGSAVGTVAYMSPEQARGETLDARTDLFSLGAMLYQLATGRHPFPGPTTAVIFDKILNQPPTAPLELNAAMPAELARILNKALDKDRDMRYQSAADLRADLKRLRREITSGRAIFAAPISGEPVSGSMASGPISGPVSGPVSGSTPLAPPSSGSTPFAATPISGVAASSGIVAPAKPKRRTWAIAIVAVVVLACAALAAWYFMPRTHPFASASLRQITDSGDIQHLAMSPDGRTLAMIKSDKGQQSLWIRNIPTNAETQILPPYGGDYSGLSFGVNGDNLYFSRSSEQSRYTSTLYVIPVFGGTPRALIRDVDSAPSFSPDGEQFVYLRQTPELKDHFVEMHVASKDASEDKIAYQDEARAGSPLWSPNGKSIAWRELRNNADTAYMIYDVAAKKAREIPEPQGLKFGPYFAWMPDSSSVATTYRSMQSDQVQIGLLDLGSGKLKPITNDLNTYGWMGISADGHTLATISAVFDSEISYYKGASTEPASKEKLRVSPDGLVWLDAGHIVFSSGHLKVYDLATQTLTPMDTGDLQVGRFIASCPGGPLLFTAIPKGVNHSEIFRVNPDGSGLANVTSEEIVRFPQCVNGDTVNYIVVDGNAASAWSIPLAGGAPRKLFPGATPETAVFSADGTLAATRAPTESTQDERLLALIHDLTHPASSGTGSVGKLLLIDHRSQLGITHFSPDGKSLVYPIREKGQSSLLSQPLDGSPSSIVTETSPLPIVDFGWSPDRSQLVVLREQTTSNVVLITDTSKAAAQ